MVESILYNSPKELQDFYLFSTLRLDSDHLKTDIGVGNEILAKAVCGATNMKTKAVRLEVAKLGDLGLVIESKKSSSSTLNSFFSKKALNKSTTVNYQLNKFAWVMERLREISELSGSLAKEAIISKIFFACKGAECKYVIRFILKNLKIGSAEKNFQSGLARGLSRYFVKEKVEGVESDYKVWENTIERAVHQFPEYKQIIKCLLNCKGKPKEILKECVLTPGVPCKPMLAKPTKDIKIIVKRLEGNPFTCEYKYDGLRGQIHYTNNKTHLFSRNLDNMTDMYPDIIHLLEQSVKPEIRNFIIDSEIVAFDLENVKNFLILEQNFTFSSSYD